MIHSVSLSNGDLHTVDTVERTITPAARNATTPLASTVADYACSLLLSGALIGPQVDEFRGIRGTWDDDRAPLAAMIQAARFANLNVADYR